MLYCKVCQKNMLGGSFLDSAPGGLMAYDRICQLCLSKGHIPALVEKTVKVTVENFIETVKYDFIPHLFSAFHLGLCHCGLLCWQQPCRWCHYYPMGANKCTKKPENWMGKPDWMRYLEKQDIFLHYMSSRFGCCAPMDSICDRVLPKAAKYEWPTGEELWAAFGPDVSKEERDRLHGYTRYIARSHEDNIWYWKNRVIELQSHARESRRQVDFMTPYDRDYHYLLQEAGRYPREAEKAMKTLENYAGDDLERIQAEIAQHNAALC